MAEILLHVRSASVVLTLVQRDDLALSNLLIPLSMREDYRMTEYIDGEGKTKYL
jgi:hypothetical protein